MVGKMSGLGNFITQWTAASTILNQELEQKKKKDFKMMLCGNGRFWVITKDVYM